MAEAIFVKIYKLCSYCEGDGYYITDYMSGGREQRTCTECEDGKVAEYVTIEEFKDLIKDDIDINEYI